MTRRIDCDLIDGVCCVLLVRLRDLIFMVESNVGVGSCVDTGHDNSRDVVFCEGNYADFSKVLHQLLDVRNAQ